MRPDVTMVVESPLSAREAAELRRLEGVIDGSLRTFYDVGKALQGIKRDKLYRTTHRSFDAYCLERWDMGRDYADRQIQAAEVVARIADNCRQLPATESQVRPLVGLQANQQVECWLRVVETAPKGKVTAAYVSKVVEATLRGTDEEACNLEEAAASAPADRLPSGTTAADVTAAEAEAVADEVEDEETDDDPPPAPPTQAVAPPKKRRCPVCNGCGEIDFSVTWRKE